MTFPGAQGVVAPEGQGDRRVSGQVAITPGGVFDHGTQEEDGPGTWEALISPRNETGATETR
jgi:hypothetical protein